MEIFYKCSHLAAKSRESYKDKVFPCRTQDFQVEPGMMLNFVASHFVTFECHHRSLFSLSSILEVWNFSTHHLYDEETFRLFPHNL